VVSRPKKAKTPLFLSGAARLSSLTTAFNIYYNHTGFVKNFYKNYLLSYLFKNLFFQFFEQQVTLLALMLAGFLF
jgi:hypothetical protein